MHEVLRMAQAFEDIIRVQQDLKALYGKTGLKVYPAPEVAIDIERSLPAVKKELVESIDEEFESFVESGLGDLESIPLKSTDGLKPDKADEFWDSLAGLESVSPTSPDVISYEQARKLGLISDETDQALSK